MTSFLTQDPEHIQAELSLLAADAILILHVCFVVFVVFGLIFILLGKPLIWSWVRNPWFRWGHLSAIGVVVMQAWAGLICPLTTWEMALREQAGEMTYTGTFISHWLGTILYYPLPSWAFTVCYTVFGALVLASWFWVPPRSLFDKHL